MTQTSEELHESLPTKWRPIDAVTGVEVRQTTEDTYELRSAVYFLILNKEGFDLYRDFTEAGQAIFEDWCFRHNVVAQPRTDINGA